MVTHLDHVYFKKKRRSFALFYQIPVKIQSHFSEWAQSFLSHSADMSLLKHLYHSTERIDVTGEHMTQMSHWCWTYF